MTPHVVELVAVLEQETALMKELVEALQLDQTRIIAGDVDALETSNQKKEELVLRLQAVDRTRSSLTQALGASLGLRGDELRVARICQAIGPTAEPLARAAETLRAVVASLAELVAVSRGFLEQSILGIRGLLSLIQGLRNPSPGTYDASGRLAHAERNEPVALRREV